MTTFEELRMAWQEQDRKLEQSLRLNRELLLASRLDRVRSPLRLLTIRISLEMAAAIEQLIWLGNFLASHISEPRFLWPAAVLDLWLILFVSTSARQLAAVRRIDYGKPVAIVQRELTALRILRVRSVCWHLLTGQLVWWIPFLIVAMKALFGIDAYRIVDTRWLAGNVLLGIALIPISMWAAKRFGGRLVNSPFWQRLADVIAGRSIAEARKHAAALAEFMD